MAATFGIKIYTVGAGSRAKAPFIVDSLFGKQVVYQRRRDRRRDPAPDRQPHRRRILPRRGRAEHLQEIYEQIDQLEKTEITMSSYMEYNERFRWFVIPPSALLLLEVAAARNQVSASCHEGPSIGGTRATQVSRYRRRRRLRLWRAHCPPLHCCCSSPVARRQGRLDRVAVAAVAGAGDARLLHLRFPHQRRACCGASRRRRCSSA